MFDFMFHAVFSTAWISAVFWVVLAVVLVLSIMIALLTCHTAIS